MFLCNICTWSPKLRANVFYGSDKPLGQAIVQDVKAIIASIPQGGVVASIDSDVAPSRFGYGESPLEVRLVVGGRVLSLQVLTEEGLRKRILSSLHERNRRKQDQDVVNVVDVDWELDSFEFYS